MSRVCRDTVYDITLNTPIAERMRPTAANAAIRPRANFGAENDALLMVSSSTIVPRKLPPGFMSPTSGLSDATSRRSVVINERGLTLVRSRIVPAKGRRVYR